MTLPTDSKPQPSEPLDPRVLLASERTLLAWLRTGLALMGFGFVVARFGLFLRELASLGTAPEPRDLQMSQWVGTVMILLGVAVNILAAVQHARFIRRYARGEPMTPKVLSLGTVLSAILAALGLALAAYLVRI